MIKTILESLQIKNYTIHTYFYSKKWKGFSREQENAYTISSHIF